MKAIKGEGRSGLSALAAVALVVIGCVAGRAAVAEGAHGTPDEAVAMVKKAIAEIKKVGKERAFAEIDDPSDPKFHYKDLYVFVNNFDGYSLAHGVNSRLIGVKTIEQRDPDGRQFNKERIELAKRQNSGWHSYKYYDTVTHHIDKKRTYFERYGDLIVSCGVYDGPGNVSDH